MLHAILRKKLPINAPNEDSLTSSVIGQLKYLPAEEFWSLIRSACSDSRNLPQTSGDFEEIHFWPRWSADLIKDKQIVEPDVFIRFLEFDLIIEAKRTDISGQSEHQWREQVLGYCAEYRTENEQAKPLCYVTMGGNNSLSTDTIDIPGENFSVTINKCNWLGLLIKIENLKARLSLDQHSECNAKGMIRLLDDIVDAFAYHGIFHISWFEGMEYQRPRKSSFETLSQLEIF
jgi:hypothetical protein